MSPILSAFGLCAVWAWPSVATVGVVMIALRGVQFALEKPSREALYTPLDLETKHKVKFLLDTVALRFGDWIGACIQLTIVKQSAHGANAALVAALLGAALWALLGARIGRTPR
jgi:AAA family ATP:ADP antiporter